MGAIAYVLGLFLAANLGVAGLSKAYHRRNFEYTLRSQMIWPKVVVSAMSYTIPWIECILAGLLILGWFPLPVSCMALALFVGFLSLKLFLYLSHSDASCGCSGMAQLDSVDSSSVIAESVVVLIAIAHLVLVAMVGIPTEMTSVVSTAVIVGSAVLALIGICRRATYRIETVSPPPSVGGLHPGITAPALVGIDQNNEHVSLSDFLGQRVVLAFVSPGCTPCGETMNVLKRWLQNHTAGDIQTLVVGQGDQKKNAAYADSYNMPVPIITPEHQEVYQRYDVKGYPTLFAIDESGVVQGTGLVVSAQHLQGLLHTYSSLRTNATVENA